jgi:hypothetical protein
MSVSGNAGTSTALAANGANCDAGYAPLGIDASGAVEGCTQYQAYDADLTAYAGITPSANAQTLLGHTFAQMRSDLDLEAGTDFYSIAATNSAISSAIGTVVITENQTITLSGILAGSGTNSIAVTAASGSYMPTTTDQSNWNAKQSELTNSAGLASALNDETGTGLSVFGTNPTLSNIISLGVNTFNIITSTSGTTNFIKPIVSPIGTFTTSITVPDDSFALGTKTTGNYVSSATATGGLTLTGTEGAGLGITPCTGNENYIQKWNAATGWTCQADSTGGSPAFNDIASGTNTTAAMVFGTGGSLNMGSGTLTLGGVGTIDLTSGNLEVNQNNLYFGNGTGTILLSGKGVTIKVVDAATALSTGSAKANFRIPPEVSGLKVTGVFAHVYTASSSGLPTINFTGTAFSGNLLSTNLTIDANETDSATAATAYVIDTSKNSVTTSDVLSIDVTGAGTGTKGLDIGVSFR